MSCLQLSFNQGKNLLKSSYLTNASFYPTDCSPYEDRSNREEPFSDFSVIRHDRNGWPKT